MKISLKARKFQEGGPIDQAPVEQTEQVAPETQEQAPAEQQDPIMMLAQMSVQALQSQDCQMAMQVCQAFVELLQQSQAQAPAEQEGEPVFRKGGVLVRRIKK